jgi:hypothetical protein
LRKNLIERRTSMYVSPNFKTKKALKEAVKEGVEEFRRAVYVYSPGPFPCPQEGWVCVEGPHYPEPHKWYAEVLVEAGKVIKVK